MWRRGGSGVLDAVVVMRGEEVLWIGDDSGSVVGVF